MLQLNNVSVQVQLYKYNIGTTTQVETGKPGNRETGKPGNQGNLETTMETTLDSNI